MHNTDNKKMQIVYSTLGIFQEGLSVVCGLVTRYPSSQNINNIQPL